MDSSAGKPEPNDEESYRKRQNPDLQVPCKSDYKRQKNETFEQNEGPSKTTMMKAMTSQETTETEEEEISLKTLRSKDTELTEIWQRKELMASTTDKIKMRAIHDFDPKTMNEREKSELRVIYKRMRVTEKIHHEERSMLDQNEKHHHRFKKYDMRKHGNIEYDEEESDYLRDELRTLKVKVYDRREEACDIEDQEEATKKEEIKTVKERQELITDQEDLQHTCHFDDHSDVKEKNLLAAESALESELESKRESELESASSDAYKSYDSEDEMDLYAVVLPFKRGGKMETIPSENISDLDGWLMARHMDSGKIGLIQRNRFVMETDHQPSMITLYNLPLEMLDIILQKSYLHWILNLSTKQRDEEVIRSLISVDVCFNRRITRQRFKNAIWRYMKQLYGKSKKRYAIIRNNRNYLLENIQPNYELIASLFSLNCITEEQSHFIQRQRSTQDKNDELLYVVETFDDTKFSNFVKCLRQTNQKTVAKIIENGGALIKIKVHNRGAKCSRSIERKLLHQKLEDLRDRTKPRTHQTDKLISQLKDEGIEILNSHLNRQTVVVWIWCHSQAALEHIQNLYELNQLRDVLFENIQPSISKVINIDGNQFKKSIVVCPISINFNQRIEIGGNEYFRGVTKLRNEIYVLCRSSSQSCNHVIVVFEDRIPLCLQKTIERKETKSPMDIGSSDKGNCLYVPDGEEKCVWKITRETDDEYKIIKWLTTDYMPRALSVSSDGRLLMVHDLTSILRIYGSDAELIRFIQLPRDIMYPIHAVETSIGNFIILHQWIEEEKGKSGSSGREGVPKWGISELTRDGQMVIRRFVPSNETKHLSLPEYLSLDSDDRVFVADFWNDRVLLLDSDLKLNQILCPTKEETEETQMRGPDRLCYDEEKKQLIVGGFQDKGFYVYTLSRN